MIVTLDIGNTHIKVALFQDEQMLSYWRLSTNRLTTSDEYGMILLNLFAHKGHDPKDIDGIMLSSVVPWINYTIEHMCRDYLGMNPTVVSSDMNTGITIAYDNPSELGGDRIANAVAAYTLYGGPCIFIDFGTATTYGALSSDGTFLGGAICPGLKLSSEALVERAAKLPRFELRKPSSVISRNTITNMQSGIVYGYVGQVNYLVGRMKEEMGADDCRVIATGGLSRLVATESQCIEKIDGLLTLKGLRILFHQNQ